MIEAGLNSTDTRISSCVLRILGVLLALPGDVALTRLQVSNVRVLERLRDECVQLADVKVDRDWSCGALQQTDCRQVIIILLLTS